MLSPSQRANARAALERRMTETVTAGTFTDGVAEDGSPTRVPVDVHYEGKARVKYESLAVSVRDGAGSPVASQTPYLSIPTGSPGLHEGTEVLVDASLADDALVARKYRITGSAEAGQTTAHRYPLEELS